MLLRLYTLYNAYSNEEFKPVDTTMNNKFKAHFERKHTLHGTFGKQSFPTAPSMKYLRKFKDKLGLIVLLTP